MTLIWTFRPVKHQAGRAAYLARAELDGAGDTGYSAWLLSQIGFSGAASIRHDRRVLELAEQLDIAGLREEFRQNYVWVEGKVVKGPRGFDIVSESPEQWSLAGRDIQGD